MSNFLHYPHHPWSMLFAKHCTLNCSCLPYFHYGVGWLNNFNPFHLMFLWDGQKIAQLCSKVLSTRHHFLPHLKGVRVVLIVWHLKHLFKENTNRNEAIFDTTSWEACFLQGTPHQFNLVSHSNTVWSYTSPDFHP